MVERLLRERPVCEGQIDGVCTHWSVDIHEILARSAGGSILDEANLKALCRACHQWVGDHPLQALEMGLRRSRYAGRNPEKEDDDAGV